jgi:hypothetical protein
LVTVNKSKKEKGAAKMKTTVSYFKISKSARYLLIVTFLVTILSGCASKKTGLSGPVFFPPPPDEPRIQYLTGISDSTEVEEKGIFLLSYRRRAGKVIKDQQAYRITTNEAIMFTPTPQAGVVVDFIIKIQHLKGMLTRYLKKPVNLVDETGLCVADTDGEIVIYDPGSNYVAAFAELEKQNWLALACTDRISASPFLDE